MASPGIKISELAQFKEEEIKNGEFKLSAQNFFLGNPTNNYRVKINTLISKIVNRDFAKSENHLSSSWDYTSNGCDVLANDPVDTIDVANGKTLSALQDIFDLFKFWNHIWPWFTNKYEPNISVKECRTRWLNREKSGAGTQDIGWIGHIHLYRVPLDMNLEVNQISEDGGYWFPEKKIFMNYGVEFSETANPETGETYTDLLMEGQPKVVLTRYEIKPTSRIGASFRCGYDAQGQDEKYAKKHKFRFESTITITYGDGKEEHEVEYFGGPKVHTPDCSPHRDNSWWGEGMPSLPDVKGMCWKNNKNTVIGDGHGSTIFADRQYQGLHGITMEVLHYCVEVYVQEVTMEEQ